MKTPYLEITYRHGKPFAAYLYLNRTQHKTVSRTQKCEGGLLVDLTQDNQPIGIEITDPSHTTAVMINAILKSYGLGTIDQKELSPLKAA